MVSKMIAVHCGAGCHSSKNYEKYKSLCRKACREAMKIIKSGGEAVDAVVKAITILENNELTNAGFGSNLTTKKQVECDASIMNGDNLMYGGCGAVRNVKNPIVLACDLCRAQSVDHPLGLIPPSLLVGRGATEHAKNVGLKIVANKSLVSAKALKQLNNYLKYVEDDSEEVKMDTVGAVCIDQKGQVASGCSSGGVLLKKPGRVGQGAIYASGAWADSQNRDETSIAVCTTGCGEHIVRTQLAKTVAEDLKSCSCPTTALSLSIQNNFINSKYLQNVNIEKQVGVLVVLKTKTGEGSLLWAHCTDSMSIGYMSTTDLKPTALISTLPGNSTVGTTVTVGGTVF